MWYILIDNTLYLPLGHSRFKMNQNLGANLAEVCALSKRGDYDYIIVGSGMGGGVLSRTLVENYNKRVLLIERGGLLFTTHCLNTSRPRWNSSITEGPSQDNDIVYNRVKQPVQTTYDSYPYVGGPVHCLGGRSNVWGLYTPRINKETLKKYFPDSIVEYLTNEKNTQDVSGYDKAYKLLCNDPNATLDKPYPQNIADKDPNSDLAKYISETCQKLNDALVFAGAGDKPTHMEFSCAPLASQFTPGDPNKELYLIPQGAFSTVDWLLDRLYKKDGLLTVLLNTEVMAVTASSAENGEPKSVSSLTVRQNTSEQQVEIPIPTSNATTTVLCAGAIDTAVIALRSGLQGGRKDLESENSGVGKGLNDHSIWGSRIEVQTDKDPDPPLKIQGWWGTEVLVNIVINANTFLGSAGHDWFPCGHYDISGKQISKCDFEALNSGRKNTIQVTFEFTAPLEDANVVLNRPESVPVIRISNLEDETQNRDNMEKFVRRVWVALIDNCKESFLSRDIRLFPGGRGAQPQVGAKAKDLTLDLVDDVEFKIPQVARGGFGVVAHEVGTMRMAKDPKDDPNHLNTVVDDNLKVYGWKDLYVCDMSIFPASPASNPSLTLVALAQRLGAHLVGEDI